MKEFVTAVQDIEAEDAREAKIVGLMTGTDDQPGLSREQAEARVAEEDKGEYTEFKLDDRVMKAYRPTPGQIVFMMAALGRGQTQDSRFAAIMNIMFESLDEADKDYLESRMLTRDPRRQIPMKVIEEIFESLAEDWFARPTQ